MSEDETFQNDKSPRNTQKLLHFQVFGTKPLEKLPPLNQNLVCGRLSRNASAKIRKIRPIGEQTLEL